MNITFLYNGDSSDINEWSNFPYFITETFKEQGHNIIRVNMHIKYIGILYDFTIAKLLRYLFRENDTYEFSRSLIRQKILNIKLKNIVTKYSDTDCFFCISDNFNPYRYTQKKCVMLCDWTYDFAITKDLNRKVGCLEKYYCLEQINMMEHASCNIVLRDECRKYILNKYNKIQLYDKEIRAINCIIGEMDKTDILKRKNSKIVFIGAKRYLGGAIELLKAIPIIHESNPEMEFYFIGVEKEDFADSILVPKKTVFCGYLNKGKTSDRELYYDLLASARICINTNEGFVSIAAISEASYLYCPIIISRHYQSISYYGENMECGAYCNNNKKEIAQEVQKILEMSKEQYFALCERNHMKFKNDTWGNLISEWIKEGIV